MENKYMSDISTLITNEIRNTLENLSRKGVGFINLETTDVIQYQIDNRIFDITVKEQDRQNARFIGERRILRRVIIQIVIMNYIKMKLKKKIKLITTEND